jgi:hypothetical protein
MRAISRAARVAVYRPLNTENDFGEAVPNQPVGSLDQAQAEDFHYRVVEGLGTIKIARPHRHMMDYHCPTADRLMPTAGRRFALWFAFLVGLHIDLTFGKLGQFQVGRHFFL